MSMERLPLGERSDPRVIGGGSPELKEDVQQEFQDRFSSGGTNKFSKEELRLLKSIERDMTPEEREMVRATNVVSNKVMARFGLPAFDVPEKNFHFIDTREHLAELFHLKSAPNMRADLGRQGVFAVGDFEQRYGEAASVLRDATGLHELFHLKAHFALRLRGEETLEPHRSGVTAFANAEPGESPEMPRWFLGLEEAIVTELEKKYTPEVLEEDAFAREEGKRLASPEALEHKEASAAKFKVPTDDIAWVSKDGRTFHRYVYVQQRELLGYIVDAIYEEGDFSSRDEVMDLFFKAQFTGRLLEIGHLIERTFGKGSFREIAAAGAEKKDPSVLDALEKLRQRRAEATESEK